MSYTPILTNPIEWNEPETQTCNLCANYLTLEEVEFNLDDNGFCNDCFYSCCGDELDQDNTNLSHLQRTQLKIINN